MSKYFKDAAGLAAFVSFIVAVIVVIALIVGGFAFAMLGLFIVFFPICAIVLAPIRRYVARSKSVGDKLDQALKRVEVAEQRLRKKIEEVESKKKADTKANQ